MTWSMVSSENRFALSAPCAGERRRRADGRWLTCPAVGDKEALGERHIVRFHLCYTLFQRFRTLPSLKHCNKIKIRAAAQRGFCAVARPREILLRGACSFPAKGSGIDDLPGAHAVRLVTRSVREGEIALRAHLDEPGDGALEFEQLQPLVGDVKFVRRRFG